MDCEVMRVKKDFLDEALLMLTFINQSRATGETNLEGFLNKGESEIKNNSEEKIHHSLEYFS